MGSIRSGTAFELGQLDSGAQFDFLEDCFELRIRDTVTLVPQQRYQAFWPVPGNPPRQQAQPDFLQPVQNMVATRNGAAAFLGPSPQGEAKLVRCTRGRLCDVVPDIRPAPPPTANQWWGTELSADNGHMVFIPEGVAHGFVTLEDDTEIFHRMSAPYEPTAARGVLWDDPALGIDWPVPAPAVIFDKDRALPVMAEARP